MARSVAAKVRTSLIKVGFSQLFPDGIQITGELFADLEQ
jgi:hypothetical protein